MAAKVGLSDEEYTELLKKLSEAQTGAADAVNALKDTILKLNTPGGGFYTQQISPNVSRLVLSLNRIMTSVKKVQVTRQTAIRTFARTMDDYDTRC